MMARALVVPYEHDVRAMLERSCSMPAAIGPTCAALVEDALRPLWPALWQRDGARPGVTLCGGTPRSGRGWERHAPAPLVHTSTTLRTLRWLAGMRLGTTAVGALKEGPLEIGDQVVIYLALDAA